MCLIRLGPRRAKSEPSSDKGSSLWESCCPQRGVDRWGHSQGSRWLQQTRKSRFISHLTRAWGERKLAAQEPEMAQILFLLWTPQEPRTFLCSDRDSAGRDDDRSQTCEVPQKWQNKKNTGARKARHTHGLVLSLPGDAVDPLFLSVRLNKRGEYTEVSENMTKLQPFLGWHCLDSWAPKEASVRCPLVSQAWGQ